ncbi:MAG: hypothetical protein M1823_003414 [Watsoniomyces obsoletus]|nr:MAG: hypothetical protein M1823_003414 [Watsoniomyces obsoletus]
MSSSITRVRPQVKCPLCPLSTRQDYIKRHLIKKHRDQLILQQTAVEAGPSSSPSSNAAVLSLAPSTPSRRTSVVEILEVLNDQETEWNHPLLNQIRSLQWYGLDDILVSDDTMASHAQPDWINLRPLPRLFPPDEGWDPCSPTRGEIWRAAVQEIREASLKGKYAVFNAHGKELPDGVDDLSLQVQLRSDDSPDEWTALQRDPMVLLNLRTPELKQKVQIPTSLGNDLKFEQQHGEWDQTTNLATKFAFVDVHIDHGLEAISMCLGKC